VPGLRIHHPALRACVLVVPHPGDPRTGRRPKDYRVHLDSSGDAIVSETVWTRLLEARASGLSVHELLVLNEVADPPTIALGGPAAPRPGFRQAGPRVVDAGALEAAQALAPPGLAPRIVAPGGGR
jgi:hypothetical protein